MKHKTGRFDVRPQIQKGFGESRGSFHLVTPVSLETAIISQRPEGRLTFIEPHRLGKQENGVKSKEGPRLVRKRRTLDDDEEEEEDEEEEDENEADHGEDLLYLSVLFQSRGYLLYWLLHRSSCDPVFDERPGLVASSRGNCRSADIRREGVLRVAVARSDSLSTSQRKKHTMAEVLPRWAGDQACCDQNLAWSNLNFCTPSGPQKSCAGMKELLTA
eukprot:s328_g11.t1